MIRRDTEPWLRQGVHAATPIGSPGRFIDQHLSPLFYRCTFGISLRDRRKNIISEGQFWSERGGSVFQAVQLKRFRLCDWFPRLPGVYWSEHAQKSRKTFFDLPNRDDDLGTYFSPMSKEALIEDVGIGTIRLLPRRIDGEDCWLATAVSGKECHSGIPLVIPNGVLRRAGVDWGDTVDVLGSVRILKDADLEDTAASVHHTSPLIIFVHKLQGIRPARSPEPIIITPVALFEGTEERGRNQYGSAQFTFVQCVAGSDSESYAAADWIERYAKKYHGRVITNFDEKCPVLADAPLSYQRLVARKYDRTVIEHFHGDIHADSIDRVTQEIHMGHKISVGGSAVINIDSVLTNVSQTIRSAPGLDTAQKSQLEQLVRPLKEDLDNLKSSHPDEAKEIAGALEKVIAHATKPSEERKKSFLDLSAKGLKEAAELVKDVAPSILITAGLIAKFVVGL